MTLCEKCIHEEVCDQSSRRMWSAMAGETECSDFKNKADFVEVRHGEWIKRTFIVFDNEIKEGYHCSVCNTTWDTNTNFCPNCGAKMYKKR